MNRLRQYEEEKSKKISDEIRKIQEDLKRKYAFYVKFSDERKAYSCDVIHFIKLGTIDRIISKLHIKYYEPDLIEKLFGYLTTNPIPSALKGVEISIRNFEGKVLKKAILQ